MQVYEYQSKQILSDFGVPVPPGKVASDPDEAAEMFNSLPGPLALVKPQGHGLNSPDQPAAGVALVRTPDEAAACARRLIGARLGPEPFRARPVRKVLVEQYIQVDHLLYLAVTIDPALGKPVMLAAPANPTHAPPRPPNHAVSREVIDPRFGTLSFQWRKVTAALGLDRSMLPHVTAVASGLYRAFIECECIDAEIAQLGLTPSRELIALQARLRFDTNALFRHEDIANLNDPEEFSATENTLRAAGIRYVELGGQVACVACDTGAALVLLDELAARRIRPGGLVYLTGDESPEKIAYALVTLLRDERLRALVVHIPRHADDAARAAAAVRLVIEQPVAPKRLVILADSAAALDAARALAPADAGAALAASAHEAAAAAEEH